MAKHEKSCHSSVYSPSTKRQDSSDPSSSDDGEGEGDGDGDNGDWSEKTPPSSCTTRQHTSASGDRGDQDSSSDSNKNDSDWKPDPDDTALLTCLADLDLSALELGDEDVPDDVFDTAAVDEDDDHNSDDESSESDDDDPDLVTASARAKKCPDTSKSSAEKASKYVDLAETIGDVLSDPKKAFPHSFIRGLGPIIDPPGPFIPQDETQASATDFGPWNIPDKCETPFDFWSLFWGSDKLEYLAMCTNLAIDNKLKANQVHLESTPWRHILWEEIAGYIGIMYRLARHKIHLGSHWSTRIRFVCLHLRLQIHLLFFQRTPLVSDCMSRGRFFDIYHNLTAMMPGMPVLPGNEQLIAWMVDTYNNQAKKYWKCGPTCIIDDSLRKTDTPSPHYTHIIRKAGKDGKSCFTLQLSFFLFFLFKKNN